MSQKVYDKKFETYWQLWEKMQSINMTLDELRTPTNTSINKLYEELGNFGQEYKSKSLVISKHIYHLFVRWEFCALIHLGVLMKILEKERLFKRLRTNSSDIVKNLKEIRIRADLVDLVYKTMKKELGLEKLEEEISLSVDYHVPENFHKELNSIMNDYIRDLEGNSKDNLRDEASKISSKLKEGKKDGEAIHINDLLKELLHDKDDEQSDDHLTENNDQGKII